MSELSNNGRGPGEPADGDGGISPKTAYIIVGVVAAAVSAATVAYFFWRRTRDLTPKVETVQKLLDRSHDMMRDLHKKLDEITPVA
jgi:hypothetical protein